MAGCMMVDQGRGMPSRSRAPVHVEGVIETVTMSETVFTWIRNLTIFFLSLSMMANSYCNTLNFISIQNLESEMKPQQKKVDRVLAAMEARFKEIQKDLPALDYAAQQAKNHSATTDDGEKRAGSDNYRTN
jgi:hypothetical protein